MAQLLISDDRVLVVGVSSPLVSNISFELAFLLIKRAFDGGF